MRETVLERIESGKIIAILRGLEEGKVVAVARALLAGGIGMIEVTFDQTDPANFSATGRAIGAICRELGGEVLAGAGTVMTPEQVNIAAEAGAGYIVSPNTDATVIAETRRLGLVSIPGALTPTEAATAHAAGADYVKLFPAGSLGAGYLKSIKAPLAHIRFLATGGVDERNAAEFLRAGAAGIGVGGNLANREWIEAGEFDKITALARRYVEAVL